MKPFDGVDKFKELCKALEKDLPLVPRYDVPMDKSIVKIVVPRTGLFNIIKRYTNKDKYGKEDIVGIGFTYKDAVEFRNKRLKTTVYGENKHVVYYDIVPQDNKEQLDPLWNPKEITKEGGTHTDYGGADTKWVG